MTKITDLETLARKLDPYIVGRIAEVVQSGSVTVFTAGSPGSGGGGGGSDGGITITQLNDAIASHAAQPDVHHARVTLANPSGLQIDAQQLQVANTLAGNGLTMTNKVLAVGAGDGIETTSTLVRVRRATTNSHLLFVGGGLAVDASSNPGPQVKILRTTGAGGVTVESANVTGALVVGQSITGAASAFQVIHHTHDYPHAHVVINPGEFWNLDEQFGVDIDDNLLVRGYIVGKHALQVKDAIMLVHYDGPQPYETNEGGETSGHMGQPGTRSGNPRFRPGRFGKALECAEATTNLISNPQFDGNSATGWSAYSTGTASGSRTVVSTTSSNGLYSYRIIKSGGATGDNYGAAATFAVTNGQTYAIKVRIRITVISGGGQTVGVSAQSNVNTVTQYVTGVTDGWVTVQFTTTATATGNATLLVFVEDATEATFYFDAVQVTNKSYQVPYFNGTRAASFVLHNSIAIASWRRLSVAAWVKLASNRSAGGNNRTLFDVAIDGDNRFVMYQKSDNKLVWFNATASVFIESSAAVDLVADWVHVAFTVDSTTTRLYVNGAEVGSGSTGSVPPAGATRVTTGASWFGTDSLNGWLDELSVIGRTLPGDEVRAIYESDAPIFAETSTWHWRVGRNRVFADAEGLWMVNFAGGAVLGAYAGNDDGTGTKSWGGVNLESSDVMIGDDSRGGYIHWDDSASQLLLVDTDLTLLYGDQSQNKVKFNLSGSLIGELYAHTFEGNNSFQLWSRDTGSATDLVIGARNSGGSEKAYLAFFGSAFNVQAASVVINGITSGITLAHRTRIDQGGTTAAVPTLRLTQDDLSEEFIRFDGTISAGNPINTSALGSYYGRVRVSVNGTFKWLALYND